MKNKTLRLMIIGMTIVGALEFAAGTTTGSNNNSYANVQTTPKISMESAKATALREVSGANANEVTKMELDREHGMLVYEIKIIHNNTKYEFDIDATTGQIIGRETKTLRNYQNVAAQTAPKISMESAKATALREVSGANANEVTKMEPNGKHGVLVYEIKIIHNNTKNEFEIDATTGQIIGRETKVLRDYQNTVR